MQLPTELKNQALFGLGHMQLPQVRVAGISSWHQQTMPVIRTSVEDPSEDPLFSVA